MKAPRGFAEIILELGLVVFMSATGSVMVYFAVDFIINLFNK